MQQTLEEHLQNQIEKSRDFFWHRLRWRAIARQLPKNEAFSLLDVGAGAGLLADYLSAEFPRASYHFIEPLESLTKHLSERYGARANGAKWPSYSGMRYLTLLDVLEHQEDDHAFLRELVSKMDVGATLFITVPALPLLWSSWDTALGHFRRYTRSTLAAVIRQQPVDVLALNYLFPEMLPMGLVRRWKDDGQQEKDASYEFPDLPKVANDALYALGRVSLALSPLAPLGTSLFAAVRKRA
ncbi:class I SAM-dependent methyltransferase [Archangium violaceum]|uniref:methyltransferase domain-containing protein n=1 Tax=Archangium violaceum TaxID=83451 RepID=UPI002B2CEF63|nr:class I SAM-dependent methyltransferase [Archangium violaceum]